MIASATSPATLLTYTLSTQPNPLQVDGLSQLVLVVSNGTGARVACQQIAVTLPMGTNAKDLITTAAVAAVPPNGWTVGGQGGLIVFTPPGGSVKVERDGLVFELAVTINGQPGTANVTIAETAISPTQPLAARTLILPVAKFPADFTLSPLLPVPAGTFDIAYGEPAQLDWTATGAGVTCTLTYQAVDGGPMVTENVPNSGPLTTQPIERSSDVVFTLTAQMTVPGQDDPMIAEQQLTLMVDALSLDFVAEPSSVGVNGLVRLRWSAPWAQSCSLDLGPELPASGERYALMTADHMFSMIATGANGQAKAVQCTVTVDPDITPNQPGLGAVGKLGAQGTPGQVDWPNTISGGPGGPGGDILWQETLPPLDTTGRAIVIPIQVMGGMGGTGGVGVSGLMPFYSGGPGGPGGNAVVELSLSGSAPSAQYIITVLPGPSGLPGLFGSTLPNGAPGTASLTIDGIPVSLP